MVIASNIDKKQNSSGFKSSYEGLHKKNNHSLAAIHAYAAMQSESTSSANSPDLKKVDF